MPADKPRKPPQPKSLGAAGKALWRRLVTDTDLVWSEHEVPVLEAAARQADAIAACEAAVATDGVSVLGSAGQPRLHPGLAEARQGRLALARLLGELAFPDDDDEAETASQRRARHAAATRWAQVAERKAARHA